MLITATNCICRFYNNFAFFKIDICGILFKPYLHANEAFNFLYENESLQHCLLCGMRQRATF